MHYIKYVLLVWVIIQSSFLKAQQYPIDVQVFVTPPYQQSLRDYWASFEPKMQVHLLLKDLNSPMRNVALRFSLENVQGQPLAQTPNFLQPFQTQLTSGVRKTLSNIELKTLFAFENLQGISENFYNDLLPEGAYFMCFTAYDVATQMPLSAKARTLVQIRRYTPPLPTLPAKGEIISKKNQFQHLVFQWMLRDPAPFTQYEFTLKEVWDNSLSPEEAFISGRLVYQGNVPSNTILYGPDKPILLENKRYVWKVRAFTQNPNNPNQRQSFFHNNGESETFYFDYVSHCEAPKFLTAITKDNTANIRWSGTEPVRASMDSEINGGLYKILYREKGKNWKSQMSNRPQATLIGLKRGRNYVYKVGVACGLGQQTQGVFGEQTYLYSTEQEFVTPHKQNDSTSVQCGVKPEIRIRNREPLQEVLGVNETFVAGDFPVTIIRATGSNGVFSGEGYVQVPYLLDTKIKVKFDGIKINSERQLFEGKLVTTYDKTEKNVQFIQEGIGEVFGDAGVKTNKIDFEIAEIKKDENGRITVIGKPDEKTGIAPQITLPVGSDYQLSDASGKTWTLDEKGEVTSVGEKADTKLAQNQGKNNLPKGQPKPENFEIQWDFSQSTFAFDASGEIPYKALIKGKNDVFQVIIKQKDTLQYSFHFQTDKGLKVESKKEKEGIFEISRKGLFDFGDEELWVVAKDTKTEKEEVIGKCMLVHLSEKEVNVTLIPTAKDLQIDADAIQRIYAKVGVKLHISTDEIFPVEEIIDTGNAFGDLSTYSPEQQGIIALYKSQRTIKSDTYYVFVGKQEGSQAGYMRLGSQFGFVMDGKERTIAHELGHGIFKLEHPFKKDKTKKGTFRTLMDYAQETTFAYSDWKQINDPKLRIGFFEEQSDGEFEAYEYMVGRDVIPGYFKDYIQLETNDNFISFISGAGRVFSLPLNVKDVTFGRGCLFAFTLEEKGKEVRYVSSQYRDSKVFAGYRTSFVSKKEIDRYDDIHKDNFSGYSEREVLPVYIGLFEQTPECGIKIYKTIYDNKVDKNQWNSGGYKLPLKDSGFIERLKEKSEITFVKSKYACDICEKGKKISDSYMHLVKQDADVEELRKIALLVCDKSDFYELLTSQLNKDFYEKYKSLFWIKDKSDFVKARDAFWKKENAFQLYYKALQNVKKKIELHKSSLNVDVSEEKLYSALYYLSDDYIKSLDLSQKKELIRAIFSHNFFINDDFFEEEESDISFLKKIVRTIDDRDFNSYLTEIILNNGKDFSQSKREVILELCNAASDEKLQKLQLNVKATVLLTLLHGHNFNIAGSSYNNMIVKVIKSVKDSEATEFLGYLENINMYERYGQTMLYFLKEKLKPVFSDANYSELFTELTRLAIAQSVSTQKDIVTALNYRVENVDYVLLSFVKDKNDYKYEYDRETNKINIKRCKNPNENINGCRETINVVNQASAFDLVLVTFLEGVDPLSGISEHSLHKKEIAFSNEGYLLPLIFLEYLEVKKDRQRFKNFAWNTFNVVLTVSTFGEGTAAMASLRVAAKQGATAFTRTLATKAIPLADFAYTTGTTTYKLITDTELPKVFGWIEGFFVTKGSYDLLDEGFKTLASLNKIKAIQNTSERSTKLTKLINELNITDANGYVMTDKQLEELIEKNVIRLETTVLNDPKVRRAWEEAKIYAEGNAVNYLDELSKNDIPKLESLAWQKTDIELFKNTFKGTFSIENAQSWKLLKDANRTGLIKNADAVEALTRVKANSQLQKLGFIDELLAKVKASKLEDGAFKNILNDLDNFGKALEKHPIEFDNFKNIISKLTDNNPQNSQAAQWIIQDITQNAKEFTGKKWKFEQLVVNSQNNNSYIDLAALDNSKYIEYKWITVGTVSKTDFLNQFVKRDLFNKKLNSFSQLEWRIKGNKLSKEKVLEYLSSKEARETLGKISAEKANKILKRTDLDNDFPDEIANAFIDFFKKDANFNLIFK